MSCINFKVRTKRYSKFFYCQYMKEKIELENCRNCEFKQYKKVKIQQIKGKKHTQTKKTSIPKAVKLEVWERDAHKCIICGKLVPWNLANAHFIPRSAGGLGIVENIFTACQDCHREQDNGLNSKLYTDKVENYLKGIYGINWNIENLIYRKYR